MVQVRIQQQFSTLLWAFVSIQTQFNTITIARLNLSMRKIVTNKIRTSTRVHIKFQLHKYINGPKNSGLYSQSYEKKKTSRIQNHISRSKVKQMLQWNHNAKQNKHRPQWFIFSMLLFIWLSFNPKPQKTNILYAY